MDLQSSQESALTLLTTELPEYLQNILLACGYDKLETLAKLDVSSDIDEMLKYIQDSFADYSKFIRSGWEIKSDKPVNIPPGHRVALCEVVTKAKNLLTKSELCRKRLKSEKSTQQTVKRQRPSEEKNVNIHSNYEIKKETLVETAKKLRQQVSKWQNLQTDSHLRQLKEHEHFEIKVSPVAGTLADISVAVTFICAMCNKNIPISVNNKSGTFILSNWTRHVKICKSQKAKEKMSQSNLHNFLSCVPPVDDTPFSSTKAKERPQNIQNAAQNSQNLESQNLEKAPDNSQNSQGFHLAPPIEHQSIGGAHLTDISDCTKPDWSRTSRYQLLLLKEASDPAQTKITDYYGLLDQIELLVNSNLGYSKVLSEAYNHNYDINTEGFGPLFKQLLKNAQTNIGKVPQARRHDVIMKKFSTSLLIYAGPRAYNFMHENMPHALPSLRTVQRIIHSDYRPISEGEFRFDELVVHLHNFGADKVVAIAEDATRVIARADYDNESERVVGFVLPCDDNGLPLVDSFLATSFAAVENMFQSAKTAKLAFVYVAQALSLKVPAFCLACLGIDNCFTAADVLRRWKYIYSQCAKRGVKVASFAADGDTRELSAMKRSCQLLNLGDKQLLKMSPSYLLTPITQLNSWSWFKLKYSTNIAYVQDTVHVAVKIKSRIIKPSIILPMGNFMAGIHHLQLAQTSFPKDQHGMRLRDIDHKDKQNFEAVMRITNPSLLCLLQQIPDAKGTVEFLNVMRCVVDSYLDETITPLTRIHKAWYAIFFLRLWRKWLVNSKEYTLQNNFITGNTYQCVELNGHALIILLQTARKHGYSFLPWLHSSQSCEKLFRTLRSMNSTFSTIINFGILGMLRRLHRLQIQFHLETSSSETGIVYPQNKVINKVKCQEQSNTDLTSISDQDILSEVNRAKNKAFDVIKCLGMSVKCDSDEDDLELQDYLELEDEEAAADDDEVIETDAVHLKEVVQEIYCSEECNDIQQDIHQLKEQKLINNCLYTKLNKVNNIVLTQIKTDTIPIFKQHRDKTQQVAPKCPIFEIEYNGEKIFIHKTTAVWLFQEGERVSPDRLIRVRETQPYNPSASSCSITSESEPMRSSVLEVGNLCVFKKNGKTDWQIGRILQFAYYSEKTKKARQCKVTSIKVEENLGKVGVLCSWFSKNNTGTFTFENDPTSISSHEFCPLSNYICTLPSSSFETIESPTTNEIQSIMSLKVEKVKLATTKSFILSTATTQAIQDFILQAKNAQVDGHSLANNKKEANSADTTAIDIDDDTKETKIQVSKQNTIWMRFGCYSLTKHHKSILCAGGLLDDIHIGAAQFIIHEQFPEIGGLQNTVILVAGKLKLIKPLTPTSLQILHVDGKIGHWIVLSTMDCAKDEVKVYDSLYTSVNDDTQTVIAALINSKFPHIKIKLMNVAKQLGGTDCGLYAIAIITCLVYGEDPTCLVFDKTMLRPHLVECFERKSLHPFPISKRRRVAQAIVTEQVCPVYCLCRLPEHQGSMMIQCDRCHEWYHSECVNTDTLPTKANEIDEWYCPCCNS